MIHAGSPLSMFNGYRRIADAAYAAFDIDSRSLLAATVPIEKTEEGQLERVTRIVSRLMGSLAMFRKYPAADAAFRAITLSGAERRPCPNKRFANGDTLLHIAARKNDLAMIRDLLSDIRTDPNLRNHFNRTPLEIALRAKHVEAAQTLLNDSDTHPNLLSSDRSTPLHLAARNALVEVISTLLNDPRVCPNARNATGHSAIHDAVYYAIGEARALQAFLKSRRLDPNLKSVNWPGRTALHFTAFFNNPKAAQILLNDPRTDPNLKDQQGQTPLTLALWKNSLEVAQILLNDPRVDLNTRDRDGYTPLHIAARKGNVNAIRSLLKPTASQTGKH